MYLRAWIPLRPYWALQAYLFCHILQGSDKKMDKNLKKYIIYIKNPGDPNTKSLKIL